MTDSPESRKRKHRILVVDDDPLITLMVRDLLSSQSFEIISAANGQEGLRFVKERRPDVVLLDYMLPDLEGLEVLKQIRVKDARLPVLFITAQGTSDMAIEAMKLCAFDFLPKPLNLDRLEHQISQAIENRRLMRVPVELPCNLTENKQIGDQLVGNCAAMQEVYKAIGRVALQDVPILLYGETGTGKELVARAIYQHGHRAENLFLKVSCADFSGPWLESELFGHEAGAFPGATEQRVGRFEQCGNGTLLIEEISTLSFSLQSKLLRVIRDRKFERAGGTTSIQTGANVILTTSEAPEELVASDVLREDLYYALSGFILRLPPLRDRTEDLPLLIEHFVNRFSNIGRSYGPEVARVSPEAMEMLLEYSWPGNVAELQSVLKRALIETKGVILLSDYLKNALQEGIEDSSLYHGEANAGSEPPQSSRYLTNWQSFVEPRIQAETDTLYADALSEMENHLLSLILIQTKGNQAQAARLLGITRASLRKKIQTLGLQIEHIVNTKED
ncbi:DNA-binding response regulator [Planctomycetales bacterium 10988]|nr:DNA-binding response regulator [Planctomycetales bacterium 10988]